MHGQVHLWGSLVGLLNRMKLFSLCKYNSANRISMWPLRTELNRTQSKIMGLRGVGENGDDEKTLPMWVLVLRPASDRLLSACCLPLCMHAKLLQPCLTLCDPVALQAPLSVGFSRQGYWSGLPCPPPGDLPDPRLELASLTSPALTGRFFTTGVTWEAHYVPLLPC